MGLFFQIFILYNILVFITLFNVFSYFEVDNLASYVLPWMTFVTLLVFIVAVPYIEYYEGGDLILVSYLCSSSIVYNFYLRSEAGWFHSTGFYILARALNHRLFYVYCTFRKEAYVAQFFYIHALIVYLFENCFVQAYFLFTIFLPEPKDHIFDEMYRRRRALSEKVFLALECVQLEHREHRSHPGTRLRDAAPPPPYAQ
ncbi:hypothetical protein ARMSODRAFT_954729 [Armillaria solidipes]|uniref:Uncharacterized protein n=1 Tax=Armillaria solidipes TaxID=1076256 RepID=A0A2H3BQJ4_9AGAR|nr:hypothetical protein ARMSODRAFT_954729 [Armillaria solidipes]